jgi:hypothetical protein
MMKKLILIVMNVLMIGSIFSFGAGAFLIGENRIGNSDFEADNAGDLPKKWAIESGG